MRVLYRTGEKEIDKINVFITLKLGEAYACMRDCALDVCYFVHGRGFVRVLRLSVN